MRFFDCPSVFRTEKNLKCEEGFDMLQFSLIFHSIAIFAICAFILILNRWFPNHVFGDYTRTRPVLS